MKELSIFEKFIVLYDNILEHPLFIVILFIPIILFFLQKKHGKKVYIFSYFLIILSVLFTFGDVIFKLFDNLMDALFMAIYFPNFITLFCVIVLSCIMALIALISTKMYKINKVINYISFGIIQFLFALILLTIRINKINIYKDNSLYANSDVLTLMQLLIFAFIFQVISVLIINIINKATDYLNKKDSKYIDKQIDELIVTKSKFKRISIDNDKMGYINVADKKNTSIPLLKPFKFNIKKIQSITLDVKEKRKPFKPILLSKNSASYLNEIVKLRKFNITKLNSDKIVSLNVIEKPLKFKNLILYDKPTTYLNEIVKIRKFKTVKLDSNKINSIYLNSGFNNKRIINIVSLKNKGFTYFNEIVKKPILKLVKLDSDKIVKLDILEKPKLFKNKIIMNKDFMYLNEIIKKPKIKQADIDRDRNIYIDVKSKPYKIKNLLSSKVYEINPKKIFKTDNLSDFDRVFNSKPVEEIHHASPIRYKDLKEKYKPEETMLVDKLVIVDIQSTLDVIQRYHFMKGTVLKGINTASIDNLIICNFLLIENTLKKYKVKK